MQLAVQFLDAQLGRREILQGVEEGAAERGQFVEIDAGLFLAIFRTDGERDRAAGQFEQLRQIAVDEGRGDELASEFVGRAIGVDEVERGARCLTFAEDVHRNAIRAGIGYSVDRANHTLPQRVGGKVGSREADRCSNSIQSEQEAIVIAVEIEQQQIVGVAPERFEPAIVDSQFVAPVVVEAAIDTGNDAIGVAITLEATATEIIVEALHGECAGSNVGAQAKALQGRQRRRCQKRIVAAQVAAAAEEAGDAALEEAWLAFARNGGAHKLGFDEGTEGIRHFEMAEEIDSNAINLCKQASGLAQGGTGAPLLVA